MDINKTINEMLSEEKGLKKIIRKVVYKATAPLLVRLQGELSRHSNEYSKTVIELSEQYEIKMSERESRIANLETNIRNNNDIIKNLQSESKTNSDTLKKVFDYALVVGEEVKNKKTLANSDKIEKNSKADDKQLKIRSLEGKTDESYSGIDYFDFENRFRGSREKIKQAQEQYLEYFIGKKKVVDIGCGRGEFLELLKDNNINAIGIDLYGKSIECCKLIGLNVLQEDAIQYLNNSDHVDGIFAGQLVEHLTMAQIIKLCEVAYDKLEDDCYMIIETPNPTSLAIYTHAFYMDPSHVKPVHPLTLQYCAEKAGFKDVKILYTKSSLLPVSIPKLQIPDVENLKEFNDAMEIASETLFGSQDYAIIAKK